jgi:hypothetical protein
VPHSHALELDAVNEQADLRIRAMAPDDFHNGFLTWFLDATEKRDIPGSASFRSLATSALS